MITFARKKQQDDTGSSIRYGRRTGEQHPGACRGIRNILQALRRRRVAAEASDLLRHGQRRYHAPDPARRNHTRKGLESARRGERGHLPRSLCSGNPPRTGACGPARRAASPRHPLRRRFVGLPRKRRFRPRQLRYRGLFLLHRQRGPGDPLQTRSGNLPAGGRRAASAACRLSRIRGRPGRHHRRPPGRCRTHRSPGND